MIPAAAGHDVICRTTLPIDYQAETMPSAVAGADLAMVVDPREKSAGFYALEGRAVSTRLSLELIYAIREVC